MTKYKTKLECVSDNNYVLYPTSKFYFEGTDRPLFVNIFYNRKVDAWNIQAPWSYSSRNFTREEAFKHGALVLRAQLDKLMEPYELAT